MDITLKTNSSHIFSQTKSKPYWQQQSGGKYVALLNKNSLKQPFSYYVRFKTVHVVLDLYLVPVRWSKANSMQLFITEFAGFFNDSNAYVQTVITVGFSTYLDIYVRM